MSLSLRDAAFALDAAQPGQWSLADAVQVPVYPALPAGPVSLRAVTTRFSPAGKALCAFAAGTSNLTSTGVGRF